MRFLKGILLMIVVWGTVCSHALAANSCHTHTAMFTAVGKLQAPTQRTLHVVLYPAIPNFASFKVWVASEFERRHPDVHIDVIDLSANYYGSFSEDYIGCTKADVYELDSVFLNDFAVNSKIQPLPEAAKLPDSVFLKNAVTGVQVKGVQYGAPHWVCGNFFFYRTSDTALNHLETLDKLENEIPSHPATSTGLAVDLKGKSTLGEFYLNAAVDRYPDWQSVKNHIAVFDSDLLSDLVALRDRCEGTSCRDSKLHGTSYFAEEFAAKKARALIGYSESLNGALLYSSAKKNCPTVDSCLMDKDIDVEGLPLDSKANRPMSWVDSFTVDKSCNDQCKTDASAFIQFMTEDATYMQVLLDQNQVPSYLLPAKASLYGTPALLQHAHLYPKLKTIIEGSTVPSDLGLNEELRNLGRTVDSQLSLP